jgi:PAS domain S-box-containing protein
VTVIPAADVTARPSVPGSHRPQQQQQQIINLLQQQQAALAAASNTSVVSLPVGVGIRLGGVGGVAPAITHSAAIQSQLAMWGPDAMGTSAHVVAERRQRNREHAKRSRVRKKFMLESLQEEVLSLQKENQNLRLLVQEHIPEDAVNIIASCSSKNAMFYDDYSKSDQEGTGQSTELDRSDFMLMKSLMSGQKCFVLSDPKLPDNPIVFASADFYKLTGYTSKEVLGRNCRFLQGPGTDSRAVDVIRKAIQTGSDCTVCILNYKADGTPFWNQFFLAALRDADDHIVNYVSTGEGLNSTF